MILLLNMLMTIVVLGHAYLAYKLKKIWPIGFALVMLLVYPMIQPSYMPKGTVRPMVTQPFEKLDIPIVDRGLKPKSGAEYDTERNKALAEINNSINEQIKLNKE
jgi:hypothetical protein